MMDTLPAPTPPETAAPTADQLARESALRRFNWLFLYTPLLVLAVGVLALLVWLLMATLPMEGSGARQTVSAAADLIIIGVSLPLTVACLLLPGLALALAIKDRARERSRIAGFQRLLWRVDNVVETVRTKTAEITPKIAQPVLAAHGWLAYGRAFIDRVWRILKSK